jgi:hypothetical protein
MIKTIQSFSGKTLTSPKFLREAMNALIYKIEYVGDFEPPHLSVQQIFDAEYREVFKCPLSKEFDTPTLNFDDSVKYVWERLNTNNQDITKDVDWAKLCVNGMIKGNANLSYELVEKDGQHHATVTRANKILGAKWVTVIHPTNPALALCSAYYQLAMGMTFEVVDSVYLPEDAVLSMDADIARALDVPIIYYARSGNMLCNACKKDYLHHSLDPAHLDYEGRPFLHVICNGLRIKL